MGAASDLALALDRVAFAREVGIEESDRWQEDLLRSEAGRVLLNAARQSGKSTITAILATHTALYDPGSLVLLLSPSLRQSGELFKKCLAVYRSLDSPVPPESETALTLALENGSRIVSLPGTEKTVRGFSGAALLIVDEAARVENDLYHAVRPMLAVSGGTLILLSTPYGKRGAFFDEWTNGQGWERYEIPATEVPRISTRFLEEERRSLPERVFRQEYLCSFEETEDQVFGHAVIQRAFTDEYAPFDLGGDDEEPEVGEPTKEGAEAKRSYELSVVRDSSRAALTNLGERSYWSLG
jgi:hypothetical protein